MASLIADVLGVTVESLGWVVVAALLSAIAALALAWGWYPLIQRLIAYLLGDEDSLGFEINLRVANFRLQGAV